MEEAIDIRELLQEEMTETGTKATERLVYYVRSRANIDQKREVLLEAEHAIRRIAGNDGNDRFFRNFSTDEFDKLQSLLGTRSMVLNEMMAHPTPMEVERLNYQNTKLLKLTKEIAENARLMAQMEEHSGVKIGEAYKSDIEGTLVFEYGDDDAVVRLDNDGYYGSDFHYMIRLISELVAGDYGWGEKEIVKWDNMNADDGTSWRDGYLLNKAFENITICHALHTLADIQPYSVPDVLRMDDFVIRVTLQYEREILGSENKQDGRNTY